MSIPALPKKKQVQSAPFYLLLIRAYSVLRENLPTWESLDLDCATCHSGTLAIRSTLYARVLIHEQE